MTHRLSVPARRLAAGLASVCLLPAMPLAAQETTTIGGSGAGGSDNVSVNLDVIKGDAGERGGQRGARQGIRTGEERSGGDGSLTLQIPGGDGAGERPEQPEVDPGEMVRGPGGAMLRFPLLEAPRSRLTVEMAEFERREEPERQPTEKPADEGEPAGEPMVEADEPADTDEAPAQTETTTLAGSTEGATQTGVGAENADREQAASRDTEPSGATETQVAEKPETEAADAAERETAGTTDDTGNGEPVELQPGTKPEDETATAQEPASEPAETGTSDATGSDTAGDAGDGEPAETQADSPTDTQTAARTDDTGPSLEKQLSFDTGSAELRPDARRRLDRVVEALEGDANRRIELTAYADVPGDSPSRSRRLSLSRALAVRSYLIEQGVRSTRIDVRALGDAVEEGPANRVDIAPATRG